jgi:hypothetical protein
LAIGQFCGDGYSGPLDAIIDGNNILLSAPSKAAVGGLPFTDKLVVTVGLMAFVRAVAGEVSRLLPTLRKWRLADVPPSTPTPEPLKASDSKLKSHHFPHFSPNDQKWSGAFITL